MYTYDKFVEELNDLINAVKPSNESGILIYLTKSIFYRNIYLRTVYINNDIIEDNELVVFFGSNSVKEAKKKLKEIPKLLKQLKAGIKN